MASKNILITRMSGQTMLKIDEYEEKHFQKPTRLFDRVKRVLPSTGEVALMYAMASSQDNTVSIIYTRDGVEACESLPILEAGSLGNMLFLHCMTTAMLTDALEWNIGFDNVYRLAKEWSMGIEAGKPSTYPDYVERLTPDMFDPADLDAQIDMYRFTYVGESRSDEFTLAHAARVRYTALPAAVDTSNNFNEVYPVVRIGNHISFNAFVPFPAQILGPYHDECILPVVERYDLGVSKAVIAEEEAVVISSKTGLQENAE